MFSLPSILNDFYLVTFLRSPPTLLDRYGQPLSTVTRLNPVSVVKSFSLVLDGIENAKDMTKRNLVEEPQPREVGGLVGR